MRVLAVVLIVASFVLATSSGQLLAMLLASPPPEPLEYLGLAPLLEAGEYYVIKAEESWFVDDSPLYRVIGKYEFQPGKYFVYIQALVTFRTASGAWAVDPSNMPPPSALFGTFDYEQSCFIADVEEGDKIRCDGIDHKNNPNMPISIVFEAAEEESAILLAFEEGEPSSGTADSPGAGRIYLRGNGSSAWWCEVIPVNPPKESPTPTSTSTPIPTRRATAETTAEPTWPPTGFTDTPEPPPEPTLTPFPDMTPWAYIPGLYRGY